MVEGKTDRSNRIATVLGGIMARPDGHERMEEVCERHGMKQVPGRDISCMKYEKNGLSAETCDLGQTIEVKLGDSTWLVPSHTDLEQCLTDLGY